MQVLTDVFILLGITILVINVVYSLIMVRKNWDVFIKDKKLLIVQVAIIIIAIFILVIICYCTYLQRIPNLLLSEVILVSAVVILLESIVAFDKIRSIKECCMEILEMVICVTEANDPNLSGHSLYVHNIVSVFYDYLPSNIQKNINIENIKYASLFIDLGKLGIPRSIISKSGKLTASEMQLMQRHPELCTKMLGPISSFDMIKDWILYHHERVDGSGYYRLKGDEIPIASRIIAIADTYSALTMDRTYRPSLSHDEAIMEIRQASGTQFDTRLVECFCEIPTHRLVECMEAVTRINARYKRMVSEE